MQQDMIEPSPKGDLNNEIISSPLTGNISVNEPAETEKITSAPEASAEVAFGSNKAFVSEIPSGATPLSKTQLQPGQNDQPVAVVQALSVRGVEYTMMTLSLWFTAAGLIAILLSLLNGGTSFAVLSFPLALLLVCLPLFSLFFIRLKRAELADPPLRFDPSKRRLTQFTQITAFAACLFNVIGFVYMVLQKIGGEAAPSLGKSAINLVVVLAIAGGILAYYWFDEHKFNK
jgi:hypothetical protein